MPKLGRIPLVLLVLPALCLAGPPPVTNDDPALERARQFTVMMDRLDKTALMAEFCHLRGPKWVHALKTVVGNDYMEGMSAIQSSAESFAEFAPYSLKLYRWRQDSLAAFPATMQQKDCARFAKAPELPAADDALRHAWRRWGGRESDFDDDH